MLGQAERCVLREAKPSAVRAHAWQAERAATLCAAHGWGGRCAPPCTLVSLYAAKSRENPPCNDPRRPPHPSPDARATGELLARAAAASRTGGSEPARPEWRGKTVRVRSFVDDGFWVRAHFALSHGLWASLRGLPFFVHLHANSSCAARRPCDAYRQTPVERMVELSCAMGWYITEGVMGGRMSSYPETWASALAYRARNSALVAAWVRVRADLRALADAEWRRIVPAGARVIGAHLRGTDKFVAAKVAPDMYFGLLDAFLRRGGAHERLIFLATDDESYQRAVVQRYGARRVRQLNDGKVQRAVGAGAIWRDHGGSDAHGKGVEVLLDTLLLSKCDFVLKSASAVSEFALYFNPMLHNDSYDFNIPDNPPPRWLTS
ncbi:hypothetical protein AB1Y20_000136 [Prymnesium parvum]|uniref:GT23 domain-containing protein n=1 Tax=Prymnesium parvum TaxID=97485 RepID=A0AB34K6Z0_PRYPA